MTETNALNNYSMPLTANSPQVLPPIEGMLPSGGVC